MASYGEEVLADTPLLYNTLNGWDAVSIKVDTSGNNRTPDTIVGTLNYSQTPLFLVSAASCGFAASGLSWPTDTWMRPASITLEAWINCTNISGSQYPMIWERDTLGARVFQFRISTTGKLDFIIWTDAVTASTHTSTATLTNNTTYYVAATYDAVTGVVALYINGVQDSTWTLAPGALKGNLSALRLGYGFAGGSSTFANAHFSGRIDDAAFYGTALSSARILAHYTAASVASTTPGYIDAFESVVATSGEAIRMIDDFSIAVASSGSVTRNLDAFEVVVAASFTQAAPTNDLWVWNGTTEIPAYVTVWNGTSEVEASVSVT